MIGAVDGFDDDHELSDVGSAGSCQGVGDLRFDLAGLDTKAAQLDHVIGSAENIDVAVRRANRAVAGVEPAPAVFFKPFFGALLRQVVVAARHIVVGNEQLAGRAGFNGVQIVVDHHRRRVAVGLADKDTLLVALDLLGDDRARLGAAVHVDEDVAGNQRLKIAQLFSGGKDKHAAQIVVLRHDRGKAGRHENMRDFRFPDELIEIPHIPSRDLRRERSDQKHHRRHKGKARHHAGTRVLAEHHVVVNLDKVRDLQQETVGVQHALGLAGGAGGVQQHGRGVP